MHVEMGPRFILSDRSVSGEPGRAWNTPGWGIPAYARARMAAGLAGPQKPMPIGARYFCGEGDAAHSAHPCAQGSKYGAAPAAYQEAVTAHYTEEHPDLHYPVNQAKLDHDAVAAKAKARKKALKDSRETLKLLQDLMAAGQLPVEGGVDMSGQALSVARPRELADITAFDFPDTNVADAGTEELELDQLISIAARRGRRFLGVELQALSNEFLQEIITLTADTVLQTDIQLNTRTGNHAVDDPEQIWRMDFGWSINITEGSQSEFILDELRPAEPGGKVYVAPRLFWRFTNNLDRQVDIGDLFGRIYSVDQALSAFLLFEMLEESSGLFALT